MKSWLWMGYFLNFLVRKPGILLKNEALARVRINRLLDEAGWRFFDDDKGSANIFLENRVKVTQNDIDAWGNDFERTENGSLDFLLVDCNNEVKSTLTGTYLNDLNCEAKILKQANANIVCGMLAYKSELEKKTIMNRFGHDYDSETQTFFDSDKDPIPTFYPYIDFVLLLDKVENQESEEDLELQGRSQIFLRKNLEIDARYFKGTYDPAIRNLVGLVRSLLKTV